MRSTLTLSAAVIVTLLGSIHLASAQLGGGKGAGAAVIPGSDVRAGEDAQNARLAPVPSQTKMKKKKMHR
jgi:hypothetical protein